MPYELNEIKSIRKKIGLTQHQLARQAEVSQSLIAKIEAGLIDPSFTKVKKIFDTLQLLSEQKEKNADDLMQKKIVSALPSDKLKSAIKKMKSYEISQMPVIKDHKAVGMISEALILEALMKGKHNKIGDIMGDAPPVVSKRSTVTVLSNLLRFFPIVLVSEKGKLMGVVTKSDILQNI